MSLKGKLQCWWKRSHVITEDMTTQSPVLCKRCGVKIYYKKEVVHLLLKGKQSACGLTTDALLSWPKGHCWVGKSQWGYTEGCLQCPKCEEVYRSSK